MTRFAKRGIQLPTLTTHAYRYVTVLHNYPLDFIDMGPKRSKPGMPNIYPSCYWSRNWVGQCGITIPNDDSPSITYREFVSEVEPGLS